MKKMLIIVGVSLVLTNFMVAQSWTLEDILEMKAYGVSEGEILQEIDKRGVVVPVNLEIFLKLKARGFSSDFVRKFRLLMQRRQAKSPTPATATSKKKPKTFLIRTEVRPPGAGKIILVPAPDPQGRVKAGSIVKIKPQAIPPYLFDQWQGDARGYYPLEVKVTSDLHLIACFAKATPPAAPKKIENSEHFRDTRRAGYSYQGKVVGIVSGQAQNKDWGLASSVYYKYLYSLEYRSRVMANNGYRIREYRTFDSVRQMLLLSRYRFHLDIGEDMAWLTSALKDLGSIMEGVGLISDKRIALAGKILKVSVSLGEKVVAFCEKVSFKQSQVQSVLEKLQPVFGQRSSFKNFKRKFIDPAIGQVLGYPPQMRLLEGKTFVLEYEDGVGLVTVSVLDKDKILTVREKELIQRAFYLSDYYIFQDRHHPNRPLRIGDIWEVDARTLAGVLDPRLRHNAKGIIQLCRGANIDSPGKSLASFTLLKGTVKMAAIDSGQKLVGQADFDHGKIFYDLPLRYVTEAELSGTLNYRRVSQDHLFFKARLASTPKVEIRYQCHCARVIDHKK